MNRQKRVVVVPWRRIKVRSCPQEDSVASPWAEPNQPCDRRVQIDVTLILPRRVAWLLAGIAVGNLRLPEGLLDTATLILRAIHPGQ